MKRSGSKAREPDEATSKANPIGKKQPAPQKDDDDDDDDESAFRSGPSKMGTTGRVAAVAGVSAAAGGAAGALATSSAASRKPPSSFEDPGGFAKKKAPAPAKKKPAYEDSDEDISPMNSDLVRGEPAEQICHANGDVVFLEALPLQYCSVSIVFRRSIRCPL